MGYLSPLVSGRFLYAGCLILTTFMLVLQLLKVIGYRHWFGFVIHFSFSPLAVISSVLMVRPLGVPGVECHFNPHKEWFQIKRVSTDSAYKSLDFKSRSFIQVEKDSGHGHILDFVWLGNKAISMAANEAGEHSLNQMLCVKWHWVNYVALCWDWKS